MTGERKRERTRERDDEPRAIAGDADAEEAAAIVAALSIHLHEDGETDKGDEGASDWAGRRWTFAGRSAALDGRAIRAPTDAPTDDWTALGRADRL